MLKIFEEAKRDNSLALGPILRVCRKWHQLAINSPSLWATIKLSFEDAPDATAIKRGQKYVEAAIHYSRQVPLSVNIILPDIYHLLHQISLRLLGIENRDLRDKHNEECYDSVYEWMREAIVSDSTFVLYEKVTDAVSEFMPTLAGSQGENLLRLRSFKLCYRPEDFSNWISDGAFHYSTPVLEELTIAAQERDDSDALALIFTEPAPMLSRISINSGYPIELLNCHNLNSLSLILPWAEMNVFPSPLMLHNLKYLWLDPRRYTVDSNTREQDIFLPSLEDFTTWGIYGSNCIKAPKLSTLRILAAWRDGFDLTRAPYFPSMRRLHWHWFIGGGKPEPLKEYLNQHPLVEELAVICSDEAKVKVLISQIKENVGYEKLITRGYRADLEELKYWSMLFPYERNEIAMD